MTTRKVPLPRGDVVAAVLDQQPCAFAAQRPCHALGDFKRRIVVGWMDVVPDTLDQLLMVRDATAAKQRISRVQEVAEVSARALPLGPADAAAQFH